MRIGHSAFDKIELNIYLVHKLMQQIIVQLIHAQWSGPFISCKYVQSTQPVPGTKEQASSMIA